MKKIVASLKYGRVWGKLVWIWWFSLALGVTLIFCSIFIKGKTLEDSLGKIGCFAYGIFSCVLGLYFIIKNIYVKAQIKKWLQDGITFKTYAKGIANPVRVPHNHGLCKLLIEVVYEEKKRTLYTGSEDRVFARFSNRTIEIIYSPKYGQAVIPDQEI